MIPNFVLIIGAMKSGTTTLYDYLAQHPQIAPCSHKEPGFFAFEEHWALGLQWYESHFNYDPARHRYALDGSTDYTKHPFCKDVVDRLKASSPRQFKLIYIMRHPLRRIESHARHTDRLKHEIGRCRSPRQSHSLDTGISPVSMAISRYAHQIDVFSEYYEKGDLLLLTLEQLARDPDGELRKVWKFLNLNPPPSSEQRLISNEGRARPLLPSVGDFFSILWQIFRRIAPLQRAVARIVPRSVRAKIYLLANAPPSQPGRYVLNPDETRAITAELTPDLIRLRNKYGIDAEKVWGIRL